MRSDPAAVFNFALAVHLNLAYSVYSTGFTIEQQVRVLQELACSYDSGDLRQALRTPYCPVALFVVVIRHRSEAVRKLFAEPR